MFNKAVTKAVVVSLLNIQEGIQQHNSVAKILSMIVMNFIAPIATAMHELLFNRHNTETKLLII